MTKDKTKKKKKKKKAGPKKKKKKKSNTAHKRLDQKKVGSLGTTIQKKGRTSLGGGPVGFFVKRAEIDALAHRHDNDSHILVII